MPLGAARLLRLSYQEEAAAPADPRPLTVNAVGNAQISTTEDYFDNISSAYFDGNDDYLYVEGTTSPDFSGDFTIEVMVNPDNVTTTERAIFDFRGIHPNNTGGDTDLSISGTLVIAQYGTDLRVYIGGTQQAGGNNVFSSGNWHHVVVERNSGSFNAWVNGTKLVNNISNSTDYSSVFQVNQPIGAYTADSGVISNEFIGYLDEIRISTTARYGAATPSAPSSPFTNDSDTYLLLHMEGTSGSTVFTDDTGSRELVEVAAFGNAQMDTSRTKFGASSISFDGTGDYIKAADYNLGSGDFTVEFWVYFDSFDADDGLFELRGDGGYGQITRTIFQHGVGGNQTLAYYNGAGWNSFGDFNTGQWYHCAVVREGSGTNNVSVYRDGTRLGQCTDTGTFIEGNFIIGAGVNGAYEMDGNMDEIRVSDTARYSGSSYTVPTAAFENDANTLFLLHGDGTNGSQDFRDDNA